jgi:hypothetical protein
VAAASQLEQFMIALVVADRPATWATVQDDRIFVVHGWGATSAIGMEVYAFSGRQLAGIPSVRAEVSAAVFPPGGESVFLLAPKRLIVIDLTKGKVVGRVAHSPEFPGPISAIGTTVALCPGQHVLWERLSDNGSEPLARLSCRKDPVQGATPVSPTRWWLWSARTISLVDISSGEPAVVSKIELPFAVNQVIVRAESNVACAMDLSVGLSGSTAILVDLSEKRISTRAKVPAGRLVWDEGDKVAVLDEKKLYRLGAGLEVAEEIAVPAMTGDRFPLRAVQVGPAEVLVHASPAGAPATLLHLGWGEGAPAAAARRARASV